MTELRFLRAVVAAVLSLVSVFTAFFIELAHVLCGTSASFGWPLLAVAFVCGFYAAVSFRKE